MKMTYSEASDAAYIYLKDIKLGGVAKTYLCDPEEIEGMINLDFDKENILIGIEILGASKRIPKELLEQSK